MKLITFFFITIILSSCSNNVDENKILIFNDLYFDLEKNETVNDLTKEQTDFYFSYLNNDQIQAPLYKRINAENYTIFLGLPINTSIQDIKKYELNDKFPDQKLKSDNKKFLYNSYTNNSIIITKYFFEQEGNIILLLAVDSTQNESNFDYNTVSKRFANE